MTISNNDVTYQKANIYFIDKKIHNRNHSADVSMCLLSFLLPLFLNIFIRISNNWIAFMTRSGIRAVTMTRIDNVQNVRDDMIAL
jgi:hypothetical protein